MDELNKLTEQIEYIFLKKIIQHLQDDSYTIPRAKQLAIDFLALQPFISAQDAKEKISLFIEKNNDFSDLIDLVTSFHIEQKTAEVIERMKSYLKTDRIDEAITIAKQQ